MFLPQYNSHDIVQLITIRIAYLISISKYMFMVVNDTYEYNVVSLEKKDTPKFPNCEFLGTSFSILAKTLIVSALFDN